MFIKKINITIKDIYLNNEKSVYINDRGILEVIKYHCNTHSEIDEKNNIKFVPIIRKNPYFHIKDGYLHSSVKISSQKKDLKRFKSKILLPDNTKKIITIEKNDINNNQIHLHKIKFGKDKYLILDVIWK